MPLPPELSNFLAAEILLPVGSFFLLGVDGIEKVTTLQNMDYGIPLPRGLA